MKINTFNYNKYDTINDQFCIAKPSKHSFHLFKITIFPYSYSVLIMGFWGFGVLGF